MGVSSPGCPNTLRLTRSSAIATPFRYWQETEGYRDVLQLCDVVVTATETDQDKILGTIPASVVNYAAYFRMNFRDSSKPSPPLQL